MAAGVHGLARPANTSQRVSASRKGCTSPRTVRATFSTAARSDLGTTPGGLSRAAFAALAAARARSFCRIRRTPSAMSITTSPPMIEMMYMMTSAPSSHGISPSGMRVNGGG
eukprot:scaffold10272_cov124-Isochrysis_galbana.AAC.6